jgi:hypothetical protein
MSSEAEAVARELDARLHTTAWDPQPTVAPATGVADFALALSGKRKQARKSGRWGKLIRHFALAACLALASVAAACDRPNANATESAAAIAQLPASSGANATITKGNPSSSPGNFSDLLLVNAGTDAEPWAVLVPRTASATNPSAPILVDRAGADLASVGSVYSLAARPVVVGTRDGPSQFLDPLVPADETGTADTGQQTQNVAGWQQDERYLAATRAIKGEPTVLDAAYNAEAAANAGGTHTYQNGVVLRVEPDQPVLQVIDKALLESGQPTRAEDVVYVAIRPSEKSLYEPGTVVNLRDVVMDRQQTDVNGQATTLYVANAALDGARVEPTGKVDLQALLQPRLQRVDQDLAAQAQDPGTQTGAAPAATATPGGQQQTVIVERHNSFVPDFLIWMWLANSGFYRGPSVIINNPPSSPTRSGDVFYSPPPNTSSSSPSTVASSQADARATALQASRSAVSGQSGGTGGGVAATNKSASEASSRVSAATAKAATVAGAVGAASAGKSISSVPKSTSSTSSVSSRSAGSVSAGSRGTSITSSSSSSSGGGFGGKGIGSSSSS